MQNYIELEIDNIKYMVRIIDDFIEVGYLTDEDIENGCNRFDADPKAVTHVKEQIATLILKKLKFWV